MFLHSLFNPVIYIQEKIVEILSAMNYHTMLIYLLTKLPAWFWMIAEFLFRLSAHYIIKTA